MNLNEYTVMGDPEQLLAAWRDATSGFDASDFFLHVVTKRSDGITILDACPTEADFQGWINGDDWRRIKAALGGDVVVTRLGEIDRAVARDSVVEVVCAPSHSH